MYTRDHGRPHFHAIYQADEAVFDVETAEIIEGRLPRAADRIVREWCTNHRQELMDNWQRGNARQCFVFLEQKMIKVTAVEALDGHKLRARFSDGSEGVRDFADILAEAGPMIEPLRDPAFFAKVFIELGAPTWPNGYDIAPWTLHKELADAKLLKRSSASAAE